MRQRKIIGIRRKGNRWRVDVRVKGKLYVTSFPLDEPFENMVAWRAQQIDLGGGATSGSFDADVEDYLARVAAMPSYKQRKADLKRWVAALGRDRTRRSITPSDVDRVLQQWLKTLSPVTVRHRRTALQSLFVKLDGKDAKNPVRASTNPKIPKAEPRGLDYPTIARILAEMPAEQSVKPGAPPKPARGRLRAAVLAYTGMAPVSLQRLTARDVDLKAGKVRLAGRHKGAGAAGRVIDLTDEGIAALKAFDAAKAYGTFAVGRLNLSFKRAAVRAGVTAAIRLYDLRHSFGREMYRLTRDLETVGRLLGHAPGSKVTERYASGANADVDRAAVAAFNAARSGERKLPKQLPAKASKSKKRRNNRDLRRAS